jgi:hypothetical protein
MNAAILEKLNRIDRYSAKIRCNVSGSADLAQALADTAELGEIARRLWYDIQDAIVAKIVTEGAE